MNFSTVDKKIWLTVLGGLIVFVLLVISIFISCRQLAIHEGEKNLENFLLTHRAIRYFVETVQKEEIYRLQREKLLYPEYFSPRLLSSTFIARGIKDQQNHEREQKGLEPLYFKFAASNPRNPINQADSAELELLRRFNDRKLNQYKAVVNTEAGGFLYYALPVAENRESCLHCHGDPAEAPAEMLEEYGSEAGFHEKLGDIRAFMSVRYPLSALLQGAHRIALTLSAAAFLVVAGAVTLLCLFFRNMAAQELMAVRLRKAQKMESIGLLAGGVAHDLNNILAGIINYPEILLRKLPEDSNLKNPLLAMQQSGQRAAAVVADLLTMARAVSMRMDNHDLNQLVRNYLQSAEFNKLKSCSNVDFALDLDPHVLPVFCSPIHIEKCLLNLLANAYEAVCEQGSCRLSTGARLMNAEEAGRYNAAAGKYCFIQVTDTGKGIPAEHLEHIFEPFYSTKKMGKSGSGLGLAVVWNAVKEHQGIVTVESGSGGTMFTLYFPYAKKPSSDPAADDMKENLSGLGQHILVVDDEAHMRDIARHILEDFNYRVSLVESGERALEFLSTTAVELVILDMLMGEGMTGVQVYEEIIKTVPGQKAIIASGYSASCDVNKALELGAHSFISKPYSVDGLGRAVKNALAGD